jgi:hypothetical protein
VIFTPGGAAQSGKETGQRIEATLSPAPHVDRLYEDDDVYFAVNVVFVFAAAGIGGVMIWDDDTFFSL